MTEIEKEIVNGFKKIQENIMHDWIYGDDNSGNFNWINHFNKDKINMNQIIDNIDRIVDSSFLSNLTNLSPEQKMLHVLGYIPRDSEFTYPMNCFLYWYIKKHCPQVNIEIQPDGSIFGSIKNEKSKNNICLNAHMDLININRQNRERIWYGAFGKNCEYFYEYGKEKESNKLFLKRKNPKTPLGADDGKGIATILNILKKYDKSTIPNLTFFLSSVEENDLYSMKHFVKNDKNIEKLFPKDLNNIAFLNLDAFEGKEIDLYSGQNIELKTLENRIIEIHKSYVEKDLNASSTQNQCWTDPMSDAFTIKMWITRHQLNGKLKNLSAPLLVSLAPTSCKPHSVDETIDIIEFGKFQNYIQKELLPFLNKYTIKKLTPEEKDQINNQLKQQKIKQLKQQLQSLQSVEKKNIKQK